MAALGGRGRIGQDLESRGREFAVCMSDLGIVSLKIF